MFISLFPPISIPCSGLSDRFKASQLRVRHPGYSDDNNLLLIFCPSDGPPDAPGVQHSIVHTSCAIVADNRFDGWLSRTRDPLADRVQSAPSDLLPVAEYYYHLPLQYPVISDTPNLSALYPIVPSFRQWKFPPLGFLPAPWREATIAPLSDNTIYSNCRLTSSVLVTETAHVIPAGEKEWFTANSMDTIGTNTVQGEAVIDTEGNTLRLRQDAHTLWDRMHYSIVPKLKLLSAEGGEQGRGEGEWVWTTHVTKGLSELHDTYHNRMLHPLKGVRREYLFARFAWDLFPMVQGFLQRGVERRLVVRGVEGARFYSSEACRIFTEGQGTNRSTSPSKRKRRDESTAASQVDCDGRSFDSGIAVYSSDSSGAEGTKSKGESDRESAIRDKTEHSRYMRKRRRENETFERRLQEEYDNAAGRKDRCIDDDHIGRGRQRILRSYCRR